MNRDLPPSPVRRNLTSRITRGIVAAACAITMVCATWTPANADSLDDRKKELQQELATQATVLDEAHANLNGAVRAAADARTRLADAQAALAAAQSKEREAEALDAKREQELAAAERKLEQAKADVAAAKAALESADRQLNEEILVTTQSNSGLLNLALIFTDVDTSNLNQRAQLAETLFDSSSMKLDELEMRRLKLEDAQAEADKAEQAATEARKAAAEQLAATQEATSEASDLKAEVARLSKQRDAAEKAAGQEVADEEKRQADLEAENASVEQRIQARIAAEKKAKAEKEAREKAAREKAARDKAAADRARAAAAAKAPSKTSPQSSTTGKTGSSKPSTSSSSSSSRTDTGFIYPVPARITSAYGMRLHPVLGYWKLHDGTDFGASCNTPIKAAASGVVSERYYNGGYGNRLMIDHGLVDGQYVTTGYNHATRYIVSVGERVSQGQVIGYVGSTGYSTGCHLHLMVWQNGKLVNPMAKWFR